MAPHIVLEWLGEPYQAVKLAHSELKKPGYLELNPLGAVPVLQDDDGWVLTEASAILDYLASTHPEANLGPNLAPRERAQYWSLLSFLSSNVHKAFGPIWAPQAFHPDKSQHEALRGSAIARIRSLMRILDDQLGGKEHPYGGRRTVIDALLFVFARWTEEKAGGLAEFPNLQRFYKRMSADQAVKHVLADEGLQAKAA
jgi:glutathione S-transferase